MAALTAPGQAAVYAKERLITARASSRGNRADGGYLPSSIREGAAPRNQRWDAVGDSAASELVVHLAVRATQATPHHYRIMRVLLAALRLCDERSGNSASYDDATATDPTGILL